MRGVASVAIALALVAGADAGAQSLGPSPYLCFDRTQNPAYQRPFTGDCGTADSPFAALANGNHAFFYLETFEDDAFNPPGVTPSVSVLPTLNESVDADDGAIDGSRLSGRSGSHQTITLTFGAAVLGSLPTHVGVVATSRGSGPAITVTLEAFGPTGTSLGTVAATGIGSTTDTSDDRFLGWISPGGIGSIRLSSSSGSNLRWDHLQYGRAAAAPFDARLVAAVLVLGLLLSPAAPRGHRSCT